MTKMRVASYRGGLNVRSSAEVKPDNVVAQLFFLQPLEVEGTPNDKGFVACVADVNGNAVKGFVSAKYLQPLSSASREALLDSVFVQHERFKRGLGQEHIAPFAGYVGEMWKAIGINLDGTDRDQPWSAAGVSFMVRKAGAAYKNFRFAAAHSKFTYTAINARDKDKSYPFWGYELHEVQPQPGDIVVRDNPEFGPDVDFGIASKNDSYRSHSDIIVHIDSAAQKAIAIGGNVGHSVGISEYDLAPGNFLAATKHTFALLVNRTDEMGK